MHFIVHTLVFALAVLLAARVVPGIKVRSFGGAVIFAVVFAVLNALLHWVLVLVQLPLIVGTLGLWLLVVNWVANTAIFVLADKLVDSVEVDGIGAALMGSGICSVAVWLAHHVIH